MKSKFKLTLVLFFISALLVRASGDDFTRNIRKSWAKNNVTALKVLNKFGEIKLKDSGGDSVTIQVSITVGNPSSAKAKQLMDKISVNFQQSGGTIEAETRIEEDFSSKQSFSIDYLINIPKDRELNITNRYGNVIVAQLEAKGYFDVSYGSFTAGNIKSPTGNPVKIIMNYGKADVENINDANMVFKYSKLYGDEIGNLELDSKYSTINLQKAGKFSLTSKYDALSIDELDVLNSVSKYTNYKIGLLTRNIDLDTGYGAVRIGNVDAKFDHIKILNSYGGISIGLNDLNYKLKADCNYCDVTYPADRFKGNKVREDHSVSIDGAVGTGGGSVSLTSRYGGVKLIE